METTGDPGVTATVTTEGEDTVAEITATEALEAGGTATVTQTTPETETKAQATETPEPGGTPGERLEDRQNGRGYNRGYCRGPNYSNQDTRGSRESSGEPG